MAHIWTPYSSFVNGKFDPLRGEFVSSVPMIFSLKMIKNSIKKIIQYFFYLCNYFFN